MMLRSDPFHELDRWFAESWPTARDRSIPMDAYRREDMLVMHFDIPGVDPDNIDLSVEQDVLRVHASRRWAPREGDELYARERAQGELSRQVMLGKAVDTSKVEARYEDGVLTVQLPIAQAARKQRIEISANKQGQLIDASSS